MLVPNPRKLLSLLSVLLLAFSALARPLLEDVQPTKTTWTNAERLKRGLPLLKPKNVFNPTPVRPRTAYPSGVLVGVLAVYSADKSDVLCYVQAYTPKSYLGKCGPLDNAQALTYSIKAIPPVAFSAGNYQFLNLNAEYSDLYLTPENSNSLRIDFSTTLTSIGDTPGGPDHIDETSVFLVDSDGFVTQKWINPDKTSYPTTIELQTNTSYLYATDNAAAYEKATGATPVVFRFVSTQ